jgi:hypothetical protein
MKFGLQQKITSWEQGVDFFFGGSNRGFLELSSLPRTEAKRASPTTLVLPTQGVKPFTEKPDSNRKVSSVLIHHVNIKASPPQPDRDDLDTREKKTLSLCNEIFCVSTLRYERMWGQPAQNML